MCQKLITIIVPVYNTEQYLERCINTIIGQSYHNLEIILVDDGSTDKSGTICDSFCKLDHRIIVLHKENEGQGIARNCALDIAKGDYFGFVDSDDYIDKFMFEKLLNACTENECDLSICSYTRDHLFIKKEAPKLNSLTVFDRRELFISYLSKPYIQGIMCNKLFRRELFDNLRFSGLRAREDGELIYKIFGECKHAVYIPESLYFQYVRPGSTELSGFNSSKYEMINFFSEMKDYINNNIPNMNVYTELLVASACSTVIKQILTDAHPAKFQKELEAAYNKLGDELNKNYALENERMHQNLEGIIKNRTLLLLKCRVRYQFNRIISLIKSILYKCKE